ncbi:bifunctional autolysin precursor [Lentilactobacillus sunkii]|jgi:N-acetylmuramoyl-L-alanine amidase|uniref:Bifunctional autolysin n=2 Tax=Lentilactobacillus sunkii TaxID=481719 RepID=A0A1E7XJK3_9LACO|nr:bifunctional autolysin precursor [Lentilactobacillus sunkii]
MLKKVFLTVFTVFVSILIMGAVNSQASSSKVNNYIASHNIKHNSVSKQIWGGFPRNKYRHGKNKPEGVVVHETGNSSSNIWGEIAYMKKNYRNAFVHTFVDSGHIINIASTKYLCWGVGYPGNARFVQFEQVQMHHKKSFAEEVENAAYYTAYILKEYHLKPNDACYDGKGTVWSHRAVAHYLGGSDHTDPNGYYKNRGKKYFHQSYTMSQFYKLVLTNYGNL